MAAAVQAKMISDMIMSMESERPRLYSSPTAVGPRYCSRGPSKPPYEPLKEASLKHLTLKQSSF